MRSIANGSRTRSAGACPTGRFWAAPAMAALRDTSVTKSAFAERTVATPTLPFSSTTRPSAWLIALRALSADAPRS
jgi:hypothetical protein